MNWMTGRQGTERVCALAEALWEKIRKEAEAVCGARYETFVPWMSNLENPDRLRKILEMGVPAPVVTDPIYLAELARAAQRTEAEPLGHLDADHGQDGLRLFVGEARPSAVERAFSDARARVASASLDFEERLKTLTHCIVPMTRTNDRFSSRSAFSSHDAKGAMFIVCPDTTRLHWDIDLQVDIAHELGHMALIVYQSADPILVSAFDQPIYSGLRKVNRPAIMSLHAAAALVYMVDYLTCAIQNPVQWAEQELFYVRSELVRYQKDLEKTLTSLKQCEFTPLGREIYNEFWTFVPKPMVASC